MSHAEAPARRSFVDLAAHTLAVWFGCGHVPYAPGTAGTLGAIPLYLLLRPMGHAVVFSSALLLLGPAIWASGRVARRLGTKDPQIVVVDEVVGVLVTLSAASPTWLSLVVGVALFRIFDQLKPFPARTFERRLPGGYGVVLDDVAAGVWGAACLVGLRAVGWVP